LRRDYAVDEIILLEGDPCQGLYLVETGWLKVLKLARTGREQALYFLGPGETFNAVSVFTEALNPATVMALELSTVWLISQETMLSLLETHPPLARMVIQDLAGRLLRMISLVEDISLRPVEGQLARFLLEQADAHTVQRRRWAIQAEMAARGGGLYPGRGAQPVQLPSQEGRREKHQRPPSQDQIHVHHRHPDQQHYQPRVERRPNPPPERWARPPDSGRHQTR
jgi:hypothetical protein